MNNALNRNRRSHLIQSFLLGIGFILCCTTVGAFDVDATSSNHTQKSVGYLPTNSVQNQVEKTSAKEIRERFLSPGVDFATAPLWVWNDLLTEDQIRSTLADLNAQHVNQAFVHPRPGLATPYLTDSWFKLWDAALDEAQKRGMKIWIYDENSYPSGFAGGYVPDEFPESRGFGLDVEIRDSISDANGKWNAGEDVAYVLELRKDQSTFDRTSEVLKALDQSAALPSLSGEGSRWIVARFKYAKPSQWHAGKTYVNLLTSGVVDKFIDTTHEAYRRHYEKLFGKLIPGAFTDEPQVASAGMFSWTYDFADEFEKRCGYSIVPKLGSLIAPIGNWKQVRYDYYKTTLDLFVERWHRPLAAYCEEVGLQYCGHDWEHEWPNAHTVPDNMATAFWRQRPSIDLLMNQFSRGTHSQFGNVRSVRELSSIVHQAGRARSLSESYGAGGYDIRFADLKRLGDWSFALGVNTADEHLSYVSIRGARKHDHPQTFSYHSPWFEQYSKLEDYWTRLSYVLSRGTLTSQRFLLIEPTSTVWMYQSDSGEFNGSKDRIGNQFAELLNQLEAEEIDYDLGSEDVIRRIGKVENGKFTIGFASYDVVVLPKGLENLDKFSVRLLSDFVKEGGKLLALDDSLKLVGGLSSDAMDESMKSVQNDFQSVRKSLKIVSFDELVESARYIQSVQITPFNNAENIFHLTRETSDALIVFICNIDLENSASGALTFSGEWENGTLERLDPSTGKISPYAPLAFSLNPCSSLLLLATKKETNAEQSNLSAIKNVPAVLIDPTDLKSRCTLIDVVPQDDNVLVMDYLSVQMGQKEFPTGYFYEANRWFWNQKGFAISPWDNGVQFKDELITRRFDDESGFDAVYTFECSNDSYDSLRLVIENPDMFNVFCNDQKVAKIPGAWKFDRSFGVFDISKTVQPGLNHIKLQAPKSTIFTELMPAFIVGKFSLVSTDKGFKIVPDKGLNPTRLDDNLNALQASSALEGVSWLSSGVGFSNRDDRSPYLEFSFDNEVILNAMRVWNYSEINLAKRGIKECRIVLLDEKGAEQTLPEAFDAPIRLAIGDSYSQVITLPKPLVVSPKQRLKLEIKSNWNGIDFPVADSFEGSTRPENDNAFVGLSEIEFLTSNESGLAPVSAKVSVRASSELVFRGFNRKAQFTVDRSGVDKPIPGWASQGYPFFAGAVDYRFSVSTDGLTESQPIQVSLERWEGAVAAVLVDDVQYGAIGWKGEVVDISAPIREAVGKNKPSVELTVRVYGTPKNLFGPHHAGKLRGSAWPSSFHVGPKEQPSGRTYDVIEYGLFFE